MDLAEKIKSTPLPTTKIYVADWDCEVYIRKMSVAQRQSLFDSIKGEGNFWVWILLYTLVDETGKLIFNNYDDIAELGAEIIGQLGDTAANLNLLLGDPVSKAKKNSETTENCDGSTSSLAS